MAAHLDHAAGFVRAWGGPPPQRAVDLGSGGGVPGLALAVRWPRTKWVLLDAMERRTDFLRAAASHLGIDAEVVRARAEEYATRPEVRGQADLVTARGFGPPAVTAECAAALLRVRGLLVVSEPPDEVARWPDGPLESLGMERVRRVDTGAKFQVLRQRVLAPARVPRRVGIPTKRPLF